MTDEKTETGAEESAVRRRGVGVVLLLGLVWLGLTLWIAHSNLATRADPLAVPSAAALSLPSIVIGAVIAGAAAGLALASLVGRRRTLSAVGRLLSGGVAGLVVGLIAGAIILVAYGAQSSIVILAATVAAGAVIGGLAAALPPTVLAAGLVATFGVLVVNVVVGRFQSPLKDLLGAGVSPETLVSSAYTLAYLTDVVAGVVAGLLAYFYLRRQPGALGWPWFAAAGGLSGLLLLGAYLVTLIGGASLFDKVRQLSPGDATVLTIADNARLTQALVVFFVGAIVAMVLVGRTIKRPEPESGE